MNIYLHFITLQVEYPIYALSAIRNRTIKLTHKIAWIPQIVINLKKKSSTPRRASKHQDIATVWPLLHSLQYQCGANKLTIKPTHKITWIPQIVINLKNSTPRCASKHQDIATVWPLLHFGNIRRR